MGNNVEVWIGNRYTNEVTNAKGYDYVFVAESGKIALRFRVRNTIDYVIRKIEFPDCYEQEFKRINWELLDLKLKSFYFRETHPEADLYEENIFVYGPEGGAEINKRIKWGASHLVADSLTVTLRLAEKLGYQFEKVVMQSRLAINPKSGYFQKEVYLIDDKYWVELLFVKYTDIRINAIRLYQEVVEERKSFGERTAKVAKEAGVPWEIAVLATSKNGLDEYAIKVLKTLKSVRDNGIDKKRQRELFNGDLRDKRRLLTEILGEETVSMLRLGREDLKKLAKYFVGK